MDTIKKYYEMAENGQLPSQQKQQTYKFSYQELQSLIHYIKLFSDKTTESLVESITKIKK